MPRSLARALLALGVIGEFGAFSVYLHVDGGRHGHAWLEVVATVWFVAAVVGLRAARLGAREHVVLIFLVGAALQIVAMTRAPQTSDDDFRYIWDAKVQLHGVDPYRYPPQAVQLAPLRSAPLFGTSGPCTYSIPGGCTAINRPSVHTIYPPVAEAAFVGVRVLSFGDRGVHLPLQLAAGLGCCLITLLLLRRSRTRGDPSWWVALWAWCPVVVSEFGNNAHIDWLAVLLVVLALRAFETGHSGRVGVLLGAAIATKLYPAVLLVSMLRRRPWWVIGSAFGFVALTYLPHVAAVGTQVIGYLPGYLHEEGYSSGNRFILLGAVFPHPLDTVVGLLVVGLATWWAFARRHRVPPEMTGVVVFGMVLLVATPHYGWYAAMLIALIALSGRVEWLPVGFASSFAYLTNGSVPGLTIYSISLGLTALAMVVRYRDSLRTCLPYASTSTAPSRSSPWMPRR